MFMYMYIYVWQDDDYNPYISTILPHVHIPCIIKILPIVQPNLLLSFIKVLFSVADVVIATCHPLSPFVLKE